MQDAESRSNGGWGGDERTWESEMLDVRRQMSVKRDECRFGKLDGAAAGFSQGKLAQRRLGAARMAFIKTHVH